MIEIGIAYPADPIYEDISRFAREVYGERLHAVINGTPDLFAYARSPTNILGCVGLTRAEVSKKTLLETYIPDALERISGDADTDRTLFAEFGTRVIRMPGELRAQRVSVSVGITAYLLVATHKLGVRYVCLTSSRIALSIAKELDISLVVLGHPDINSMDNTFRENWKDFFRAKQYCFGCVLNELTTCKQMISRLAYMGILCAHMPDNTRSAA